MNPKVKAIEIRTRKFEDGASVIRVQMARWTDWRTEEDNDLRVRYFWRPTATSIARVRRAQDRMVAK